MHWLSRLFHRRKQDTQLDSELRFHVEQQAAENIAAGMNPGEARRHALAQFGGLEYIKEETRDARGTQFVESLVQDVRYALRMLHKSRGFTAVVVLTLALGIGANTAIFALIDAVELRPLSVPNPHQLVLFEWLARNRPRNVDEFARFSSCPVDAPGSSALVSGCSVSYPMFEQIRAARDVLSDAFCFGPGMITLSVNDHIDQLGGMYVSGDFFPTLGSHAALGRTLGPSDDVLGAAPVIVLSYDFWQSELGADPTVIGKPALINRQPFRIIGIAAPNFPRLDPGLPEDFWIPLASRTTASAEARERDDPHAVILEVIGRLKPTVSRTQAEAQLNAIFVRNSTNGPTPIFQHADEPRAMLGSAAEGLASLRYRYSKSLLILMAATGLILLLASCNVAGLLLARSSARQKEIAVRSALGAGRWRILRQLLTESLLLALAGGSLGLLVAEAGAKALAASITANSFFPIQFEVGIDWRVLAFLLAVSTLVGLLFGLAPAFSSCRADISTALNLGTDRSTARKQAFHLRNSLVFAQVAISMLVLVGAALLARTIVNLETVNVGFNTRSVLLFRVNMDASGFAKFDDPRYDKLNQELQERFAALPGVKYASYSMMPPLDGGRSGGVFKLPGAPDSSTFTDDLLEVGPGFFETMGIPLLEGRTFKHADFELSEQATPVVINEAFARTVFGRQNPVGQTLDEKISKTQYVQVQVVGVVKNGKYEDLRTESGPTVFTPDEFGSPTFELRTAGDPRALASMVRDAVARVSHEFVVLHVMTQTDEIDKNIYRERLLAMLSVLFSLLALALACIGLYGLVAYAVARRTHEIGIRMALGAQQSQVLWLTAKLGLMPTLAGVVIGVGLALGATRYLRSLLFGVQPTDAWTFLVVATLLAIVASAACVFPARRAMKVDPMVALRHE